MDEITENLASLTWWVSVVVVGILLNLVSAYLKPPLDKRLAAVSRSWRDRSEARRAQRAKLLSELRANPHKQYLVLASEARHRTKAIVFLLVTLFFFLGYTAIGTADLILATVGMRGGAPWDRHMFLGGAALMFFFFLHERASAERCKALVSDAQDGTVER